MLTATPVVAQSGKADIVVTGEYQPVRSSALNLLGDRAVVDTPFSITVFDQAVIANQQARTPLDVLKNDSSVLVTNTGLTLADTFSVRGFSLNNLANFRQDGGFLINLANIPLEDKERVEVLKGLTGFLYGFTAPGGIVNFVTKRPLDDPFATVTGGYSNRSLFYGHFDGGARFGPDAQFGLRANLAIEKGELPVDGAHLARYLGAVAGNWQPTSTIALDLDYSYQKRNAHGLQDALLLGAAVTAVPDAPDASRLFGQRWETYDTRTQDMGARARWTPGTIFTVELQARRSDLRRAINALTATLTNLNGTFTGAYSGDDQQRYLANSAQALLLAKITTWPIVHDLTGGWMGLAQSQYRGDFATAAIPANNLYNPVQGSRPNVATSLRGFRYRSLRQTQGAFLLSDTATFGPVTAIAGVRFQKYRQVSFNFTGATTATYDRHISLPTFALIVKPVPFASIYASYAKGLEQGGTAPTTAVNAGEVLPPLTSKQTEIGAKLALPRGLTLTAAVFDIQKGLEFLDTTTRVYTQAGQQQHRGFETSVGGRVLPGLFVTGGYTYLDAEAKNTGVATTTGKRPVNVPKNVFTLYGEYRLARTGLAVSGAVRHLSNFAYDATNARFVPGYTTLDLGARYTAQLLHGGATTLRVNVNNVTDKDYWAGTAASALYIGAPRTWRLSIEQGF